MKIKKIKKIENGVIKKIKTPVYLKKKNNKKMSNCNKKSSIGKTRLMKFKSGIIKIDNPFIRTQTLDLRKRILRMIELSIEIQKLAFKALEKADREMALQIFKIDDRIDWKYNRLMQEATFTLAQSPLAKELRRVVAYIQIAKNLEWIGDCAVKIAKFIISLKNVVSVSSKRRVGKIHKLLYKSLLKLEKIIIEEDPLQAIELAKLDENINVTILKVSSELIKSITNLRTLKLVDERVYVLKIIDSLESAADHIVDICENIVYIKTGIIHGLE